MSEPRQNDERDTSTPAHAPYLKVFRALLVLTVLEYIYATYVPLPFVGLVAGLLVMAIVKATLVGMYFMHLKFEGNWVYGLIVPAGVLAAVLVSGLAPDMASWPSSEPKPAPTGIQIDPDPTGGDAMHSIPRPVVA
jgi:cytochrome c oxidase subunit 4